MEEALIVPTPQVIKYATVFDEWKWDHFVRSHGLECASLDQYYLGKNLDNASLADYKKLLANLFSDAISSGAVFLPSPYLDCVRSVAAVALDAHSLPPSRYI